MEWFVNWGENMTRKGCEQLGKSSPMINELRFRTNIVPTWENRAMAYPLLLFIIGDGICHFVSWLSQYGMRIKHFAYYMRDFWETQWKKSYSGKPAGQGAASSDSLWEIFHTLCQIRCTRCFWDFLSVYCFGVLKSLRTLLTLGFSPQHVRLATSHQHPSTNLGIYHSNLFHFFGALN